ncbi:carbohydrate binding family 9 domain-containing protein [Pseudohongiella spirulinae]|uniref:Putative membrane associated hydrolase n=1 Tax=Pseudohongiella spirulinae TaxID=1249552 RepID=A0A0S2KBT2_9GAMM|nr:carbohydrate binding family 9 domain-containing protein [Pseudohongiella spirulinae]ALO45776.1 Putative membrane associated hydrolase [Pseudohongiella spirulinae]
MPQTVVLIVLLLILGASSGYAQENVIPVPGRPTIEAYRMPVGMDIRLDGLLDEEVWAMAVPITEFRQQEPVEGGQPSERTEIRIVYDDDALYIGAMLYDSDPDGILAYQLQRDAGLGTDDRFMWIISTFDDNRTGYFFETNPVGLLGDGLIEGGGGFNKRWNGLWNIRTAIRSDGWSAEIRIPFSTLNFDPALTAWGINFQRTIRRHNEEILWNGWRRVEGLFRPIHTGLLTGLEGISQGRGIELKPFINASTNRGPAAGAAKGNEAKAGIDITYSLTPSLRGALTINTDFAEVEVDSRQVNLTRFPLRFPEQREFFLEGSGVFSFNWADPFFSRRIGLVDGQEVPIDFGGRLGGQVGDYELGVYQVRTGETTLDNGDGTVRPWGAEDFTVARVKRRLFRQSHVGMIYTRRASDGLMGNELLPDRHTVGADFNFFTSQFLGRQLNAQVEGFMVHHTDPVNGGDLTGSERRSRGIRWSLPNDLIRVHSSHREFGEEWNPAVGFVERRGFRRHQPTLTIAPRPSNWSLVRQTEHQIFFEYLTDLDDRLLTRNLNIKPLQLNFESGDRFSIEFGQNFERLDRAFTVYNRDDEVIRIQPGDYDSDNWSANISTAGRRMLSGSVNFERSEFWGGDRDRLDVSGTIRPRVGISVSANYQRNEVSLPQGEFDTNLVRLSWAWNFNPWVALTGNVQYDDLSEVVGVYARLRWIIQPGNDVFLVWSNNWLYEDDPLNDRRFTRLTSGGALKVNYTFRF